jgi:hypothetical protein
MVMRSHSTHSSLNRLGQCAAVTVKLCFHISRYHCRCQRLLHGDGIVTRKWISKRSQTITVYKKRILFDLPQALSNKGGCIIKQYESCRQDTFSAFTTRRQDDG